MREIISFSGQEAVTKTLKNGAVFSAQKRVPLRVVPGSVAEHEAAHVVAAGRIKYATIIPSGNVLGTTAPEIMTAKAAAAAAAFGHNGTGWDMFLTEYILGVNPESAKAEARSELVDKKEELHEVASILEERKTIGQSDVEEARENVQRRKNGIHIVDIKVLSPTGEATKYQAESFKDRVLVEDEFFELPKAA